MKNGVGNECNVFGILVFSKVRFESANVKRLCVTTAINGYCAIVIYFCDCKRTFCWTVQFGFVAAFICI
jgi:hypothetical protein